MTSTKMKQLIESRKNGFIKVYRTMHRPEDNPLRQAFGQ